jgi:hypothetical protein
MLYLIGTKRGDAGAQKLKNFTTHYQHKIYLIFCLFNFTTQ